MTQAHFDNARPVKVAVWDLPTRLFHWTLVLLIVFSVTTVKVGGEWMIWHERSGRALLVLLTFRIVWGFIGGEHARWINFICSPFKAMRYAMGVASGRDERYLGHNPLGAYSVIALLAAVATQGITGLFVDDAIVNQGPLVNLVSSKVVEWATRIHHWNERVIYGLIAVHLGAIFFYLFKKKDNLIGPMIHGSKQWHESVESSAARGSPLLALVVLVAVGAVVLYLTRRALVV